MSISIATAGKFSGPPTQRASAKYGGGTSAGIQYLEKPHKFPNIHIKNIKVDKVEIQDTININIDEIKES